MNMQMSPASTHSLTITCWSDWLQGGLWRQKHQRFHNVFLVHCSFKEEMLSIYQLTHGLSVLKTPHTHINNIKSRIFTWCVIRTYPPHVSAWRGPDLTDSCGVVNDLKQGGAWEMKGLGPRGSCEQVIGFIQTACSGCMPSSRLSVCVCGPLQWKHSGLVEKHMGLQLTATALIW